MMEKENTMDIENRGKLTKEQIEEMKKNASEKHGVSSSITYMSDEELAAREEEKKERIAKLKEQFKWGDDTEENGDNELPFPESNELEEVCGTIAEWLTARTEEKKEQIAKVIKHFDCENGDNELSLPESNELEEACGAIAEWASKNIAMDHFYVDKLSFVVTVPTEAHPIVEKICDKKYSYDSVCLTADGLSDTWETIKDGFKDSLDARIKELFPATGKWKPTILLSEDEQKVSSSTGTPLERMGVYDSFLVFDEVLELTVLLDKND